MEPDASSQSQLFDSLKDYLNNKNRLQPIIGLSCVVEVVNVETQNKSALYFCHVCVCRLNKADMRNHILGSLHRYNYIKASQPHLVSQWQENSDLSKQAWPLMALAKTLENREGPGHVQLLEVEDAVHQRIATWSESYALTLINTLKREQGGSGSSPKAAVESQRIVLFPNNHQKTPEFSHQPDPESGEISPNTGEYRPEPEMQSYSQSYLEGTEIPDSLECESSFLDDYAGSEPLIGIIRLVELKGQDGCSLCFLCHCCRIKSSQKDIIDHLTSSSHLINYLMEIYPDQLQAIHDPSTYDCQLLQLLAMKGEHEKSREELKVEHVPEPYCSQLSGKSYHWCLKMLSDGWTPIQKQTDSSEGNCVEKSTSSWKSFSPTSRESQALGQKKKKKKKQQANTVFVVNLPLRKGAMLLERQSFSTNTPSSDLHRAEALLSELECGSQLNVEEDVEQIHSCGAMRDFCGGDLDVTEDPAAYLDTDDGFGTQYRDAAEAEGEMAFDEKAYDTESQEFSNEAPQMTSGFFPDPHREDLSFCGGAKQWGTEQCYRSALNTVGTNMQEFGNEGETSSCATQYQQVAWSDAAPPMGSMWGYYAPVAGVPPAFNMSTCYRDAPTHRGSISAPPIGGFYEADFFTGCTRDAPQSNPHLAMTCEAKYSRIQRKLMDFAHYRPGLTANLEQAVEAFEADALTQPSYGYHTAGF
ncbi:uncharacterized protein si:ch211-199g17.2 [Oryzias melastigma]|uniref:uncharacterized protein si:ch211-199g17.2 n=1 Tax=Oryzias melastigma TaxID=30732 RepID=UPI000CF81E98|nr:uncharacterized protein si:ch211-199g17.2 [Oryzias melastigma]